MFMRWLREVGCRCFEVLSRRFLADNLSRKDLVMHELRYRFEIDFEVCRIFYQ